MGRRTIRALDEWLTSAARARPDHPALVAEGRTLTHAELEEAARRTAHRLAPLGCPLSVAARPGLAFSLLLHAAPKLGTPIAPVDPRAGQPVIDPGGVGDAAAAVPLRERVEPEDVHSVVLTSGTTGEPKPVELSYANHYASARAWGEVLGVQPQDRWLCVLPLFHVAGLAVLLRAVIHRTTVVIREGFDPEAVREELETGQITLVSLVPTMLHRLREAGLRRAPSVRAVLLGGGPVPGELLDWSRDVGLPVLTTYGMTETASGIAVVGPGEAGARPLPGVELATAGDGEVLVRGPMVSRAALAHDGWLHTGDRGRLDEEGRLHVEGRLKELIVTGGEKVSPVEVEEVLRAHPAVSDAGVVGLPDPEWGEAMTAFVVLSDGATAEELIEHCRRRLAAYKVPKRVEQVAGLPRSPSGKLLRDQIVAP